MKNRISLSIACLFLLALLPAQTGTRVYEFMNITTSPRQAALGGNAQSMWDADPNMAYWNPALMNENMHKKLALNYVNYLADIQMATASFAYQWDDRSFFSVHGQYMDYGDFMAADEIGQVIGNFGAKDINIQLAFAYNISDFFTVGAGAKFIHSQIEMYRSYGIAADLGVVLHDIDYNTNVALSVRNLGYQLKPYDQLREPLPLQVNLGVSHKLEHVPLEVTATLHNLQTFDMSDPESSTGQPTSIYRKAIDHVSVGAELFPGRGFNLRAGYNFKRGNELNPRQNKNFSGVTFGFGLRVSSFRLEYAHAQYYPGSNTDHFGLIIDLENFLEPRYY
ncbi:MAG: type IX secretion system protein PorQ [Weeksellaceae bacterium]|nr:type IX secretion system protein PorQ [Weeksellaceae bacterium]